MHSGKSMTLTELVEKLNQGGWHIARGRVTRDLLLHVSLPKRIVVTANSVISSAENSKYLVVKIVNGEEFLTPADRIVCHKPWSIAIHVNYPTQTQVKGGGWADTTQVMTALHFRNNELEIADKVFKKESVRAIREELSRQAAERELRIIEEREAMREKCLIHLRNRTRCQTIEDIDITEESVTITFLGGGQIAARLYGAYPDSYLMVNGEAVRVFRPRPSETKKL